MRSACWGARSVRSLITMRPLVVSITIALALSRLAGSGWAIAGAAQISAATKARMRIMKSSGIDWLGSGSPGAGLDREWVVKVAAGRWRFLKVLRLSSTGYLGRRKDLK